MKIQAILLSALILPLCTHAADTDGVKDYLVKTVTKMKAASDDFVKESDAYAAIIAENGGDYQKAYAAKGAELKQLVSKLQEDYKAMDSYGYETVEGIVAGVEKFSHYDVYLDAGVPEGKGEPDTVSPLVLHLSNGKTMVHPGCSFTYIIEPMLWGGDEKLIVPLDLNGDGKIAPRESLPKQEILSAIAVDTQKQLGSLLADAQAWKPTMDDCFAALVAMTPTLSDYFEDWKESRYSAKQSGRFFAVSRVSDMKGIMMSCDIMYRAVQAPVAEKDKALAKAANNGFGDILAFLDQLAAREKKGEMTAAEIDELANQAKAKTDQLVPQIKQAAALLSINVAG